MTNPRHLMDFHELEPKKSLGQNFIHDPNTLHKIVEIANIQPGHTVLEIGTGTGALTALLAAAADRVVTLEVDDRLMPILRAELAPHANVDLYLQDILDADISALIGDEPYQVVANLPYYITSAIVRKLLEADPKPDSLTLTIQREVAERMIEKPNNMSLLTVSVQFYGAPKIAAKVSKNVFYPRPDVDSAVVYIDVYEQPPVDVPDEHSFFEVVRAGFSQKRKQLKNSVASGLHLASDDAVALMEQAGIDPKRRAETLTLEEWAALTRAYQAHKGS